MKIRNLHDLLIIYPVLEFILVIVKMIIQKKEGGNLMAKNTNRSEIDSLSFEVENQELSSKLEASGTQLLK